MNVLEMKHIRKSYRAGVTVLNDLSLSVAEGEVLALIGSSGSGKSTVLRCAAQLERIDCGEIVICGKTLVRTGQRTDRAGKAGHGIQTDLKGYDRRKSFEAAECETCAGGAGGFRGNGFTG